MSEITAIMIDSREPKWVQQLKFGGIPTMVSTLETGDIQAVTDDNHTLIFERKTQDDFLNTLKDQRLFPQLARMVEIRNVQLINGEPATHWAYVVIEEPFTANRNGKVITSRGVTGWSWASLQGTLRSIQHLGIYVEYANGALDFEDCILRIGRSSRNQVMRIMPAKIPNVLGPKATFLASLPGLGVESVQEILAWANDNLSHALSGLTDLSIPAPIGTQRRKTIKTLLGLEDGQSLEVLQKEIS